MPRQTRIWSEVRYIGPIWQPGVICAQSQVLSDYDLRNIGEFTRENVEHWLCLNAGDFSGIDDFYADLNGEIVLDWAKGEESELAYCDMMYPCEDFE